MVMSINISLSESGPINLDDILKEATAFRSEDTSRDHDTNTETHTALESSELACTQKLFGSAKRKTRVKPEDQGEWSNDSQPHPEEHMLVGTALEARTLRTIAGPSSTSADVANGDVRKRQSYTLLFKRECVRRIRHGGISMNQMSRETGIDRRCLRSWLKQEAQLLEESQVECTRKRVSGGGRKASYYQVEKKLNEWYQAEALAGRDVTYRKLNIVAYRFAKECGVLNPINFSKEFLIKWQKKNHLMFKTKNAHVDSYPASTSSSSFDLSSDEPEPKSLIDLLFEGIEGQFADVEAEVCEASTSASTLPPQHSATVFAESSELMSGADVDAPPLLSANEEGDGYGSETPPHLDIEQSDHGSLDVNSGKARHSQSIGVESTNLSQEISEGRRERAHAQMAALSNQVQFA